MRLLPPSVGQKYLYGHGRLGVLMDVLLTQTEIDRFLGAPDFAQAKTMLTDVKYIRFESDKERTEETLERALREAWETVSGMMDEDQKRVLGILWMRNDIALLSYLIKQARGMTSDIATRPEPAHTAFDASMLEALASGQKPDGAPKKLATLVDDLLSRSDLSAKMIDAEVSRYFMSEALRIAKKHGTGRIKEYVRHSIDLQNVRSFLRSGASKEFEAAFISGGLLPFKMFTGDIVDFAAHLTQTPYAFLMKGKTNLNAEEWSALEQAIANVRIEDLKDMWNTSLGVEPIFAFLATVIEQLSLLRAILIGKRAGMSPQEIKALVPKLLTSSRYA